ncbi:MAG TPA: ribosome maturation factor RimM [Polyangia bacterium]|nr:ribosome maturation factor RimM [Polyangia bacterium]
MAAFDADTVLLGVVGKPHGVHGELWLRPHNAHGRSFDGLRAIVLDKAGVRETRQIVSLRWSPDGALVRLAGVDSREAAAALTLAEVRAPRASLPPLAPGEFYVSDVIGCAVSDEAGRVLGVVAGTFWNGAQDVMIVGEGEDEQLIPLIAEFVVAVDAPARKVVVRWEGHD